MSEIRLKAFDLANDLTKQIIALSLAVVVFSVTFFEKLVPKDGDGVRADGEITWILQLSWLLFGMAATFGILTMSSFVSELARPRENGKPTVFRRTIRISSLIQYICFLSALFSFVVYGFLAF